MPYAILHHQFVSKIVFKCEARYTRAQRSRSRSDPVFVHVRPVRYVPAVIGARTVSLPRTYSLVSGTVAYSRAIKQRRVSTRSIIVCTVHSRMDVRQLIYFYIFVLGWFWKRKAINSSREYMIILDWNSRLLKICLLFYLVGEQRSFIKIKYNIKLIIRILLTITMFNFKTSKGMSDKLQIAFKFVFLLLLFFY